MKLTFLCLIILVINFANPPLAFSGGSIESCFRSGDDCVTAASNKNTCELFVATCAANLKGKSYEAQLRPHLISCSQSPKCEVRTVESLMGGCKNLGAEVWNKANKLYHSLRENLNDKIEMCLANAKVKSGERVLLSSAFHECVLTKIPSLPSMQKTLSYLDQKYNLVTEWFAATGSHVREVIDHDCSRFVNQSSKDSQHCRFASGMNALLDRLQTPYEKLGLKETTDKITDSFVNRLVEHQMQKGCFDAAGTGLEFCLLLAGIAEGGVTLAEAVPLPVTSRSKALREAVTDVLLEETNRKSKDAAALSLAKLKSNLGAKGLATNAQINFEVKKNFSGDNVNYVTLTNENGQTIGKMFGYAIKGDTLELGMTEVDEKYRGVGASEVLFHSLLEHHPEVKKIKTMLYDVNESAFNKAKAQGLSDMDALKETPAYKIRAKAGWSKISDFDPEDLSFTAEPD